MKEMGNIDIIDSFFLIAKGHGLAALLGDLRKDPRVALRGQDLNGLKDGGSAGVVFADEEIHARETLRAGSP